MSVWSAIETAPLAAAALGWHQLLGPDFGAAAALCLRETQRRAERVPCPHGCGCGHRVVPVRNSQSPIADSRGRFIGVCDCDEPDCEDLVLRPEEAQVWELDIGKLGRKIGRALGCDSKAPDLRLRRTIQIGALGGGPLPIVMTLQHDEGGFRAVAGELVARLPKGFVLLAPTSRFCSAPATEMLARINAGFFSLERCVTVLPSGKLHAAKSGAELFKGHLPEKREPVKESEAVRIFAILQRLRSKRAGMTAPLYDVFVATVLEGVSQREAAKRCDCSPALMSKRVGELKKEFGLPLKQLQNYAKPLLEMQTSVKGERRRKRKPGSIPGAFADDSPSSEEDDTLPQEEYRYEGSDKDD